MTTPPPQMQHCNQLSVSLPSLQTQFDAPYMFSPEPSPLVSASSHSHDVFGPLQIPFQQTPQSYYDQRSPLSSMHTTPSDVAPNMYVPVPAPSSTSFESHFSYFAPAAHAPVYGQSVYQQLPLEHIQQEYAAMHAKPSFLCYGGQSLAPFEGGHGLTISYPGPYHPDQLAQMYNMSAELQYPDASDYDVAGQTRSMKRRRMSNDSEPPSSAMTYSSYSIDMYSWASSASHSSQRSSSLDFNLFSSYGDAFWNATHQQHHHGAAAASVSQHANGWHPPMLPPNNSLQFVQWPDKDSSLSEVD
ncbi:uncharacterized protein PHACADRAFT_197473 [Phanerochaete carnosa HHB-10118-sp]|uniref:Uncharacterized protein n=1 Tax=Phanerochaete carnosa (strain HHB-10118-sp) TaxID=650164 RepID=K5W2B8_PHACS|nr:uncharacterized protein PHACADRAFT_197473 [Phanerochaete carnosa HHB-10118-sp]EKM53044.1 hypothetical protein PHACADRAFT_197473 [Phanerochaete carnosa HHB-10118-sp]